MCISAATRNYLDQDINTIYELLLGLILKRDNDDQ